MVQVSTFLSLLLDRHTARGSVPHYHNITTSNRSTSHTTPRSTILRR